MKTLFDTSVIVAPHIDFSVEKFMKRSGAAQKTICSRTRDGNL